MSMGAAAPGTARDMACVRRAIWSSIWMGIERSGRTEVRCVQPERCVLTGEFFIAGGMQERQKVRSGQISGSVGAPVK